MQARAGVPRRRDVSCSRTRASRMPRRCKACRFAPLSATSGSTRARVTRRPCHDQRKPGAPIWNSPPVSRQVIGRRRLGVRLGRRTCRGYDPARLMELAQPTAGCQRPTGLDPKRPFRTNALDTASGPLDHSRLRGRTTTMDAQRQRMNGRPRSRSAGGRRS
jgi:hypothetical protein